MFEIKFEADPTESILLYYLFQNIVLNTLYKN